MGLWQLGVYDSRQEHERAESQTVPRVALEGLWGADDPFEGRLNQRPVTIEGEFAPADEQMWVAGKVQDGRTGVWLLSPVIVGDAAIVVVRGWAPAVAEFPDVPAGEVTIEAVLQGGDAGGAPFDPKTREIGAVRIPALTNELPYDLYSGFAISTTADVAGGLASPMPRLKTCGGRRACAISPTRCSGGCSGRSRSSCGGEWRPRAWPLRSRR